MTKHQRGRLVALLMVTMAFACDKGPAPEWKLVATSGPSARVNAGMAYDKVRKVTVLFGGSDGSDRPPYYGRKSDTWRWDGLRWTLIPISGCPTERSCHAMVFNDSSGTLMLVGGENYSTRALGDVWQWDGELWTLLYDSSKLVRPSFAGAYDAENKKVVIVDGGSTWELDYNKGTRRDTHGPTLRISHTLIYDAARKMAVLFGGAIYEPNTGGFVASNDTWLWDGTKWQEMVREPKPPARWGHAMVYHARRRTTVLFGGLDITGRPLNDLWEFDGKKWRKLANVGFAPEPRIFHSMAYDSGRDKVVLFGGKRQQTEWDNVFADTWEW